MAALCEAIETAEDHANDYTISFAGRRYQGRYLMIEECGARAAAPVPAPGKPPRKDHNAGGKSDWMRGFFDRPTAPLGRLIRDGT